MADIPPRHPHRGRAVRSHRRADDPMGPPSLIERLTELRDWLGTFPAPRRRRAARRRDREAVIRAMAIVDAARQVTEAVVATRSGPVHEAIFDEFDAQVEREKGAHRTTYIVEGKPLDQLKGLLDG